MKSCGLCLFIETGSHVSLTILVLAIETRLASRIACLCLLNAGTNSVCHHAHPCILFYAFNFIILKSIFR